MGRGKGPRLIAFRGENLTVDRARARARGIATAMLNAGHIDKDDYTLIETLLPIKPEQRKTQTKIDAFKTALIAGPLSAADILARWGWSRTDGKSAAWYLRRKVAPEKRAWIVFESGVYRLLAAGPEAPAGWVERNRYK